MTGAAGFVLDYVGTQVAVIADRAQDVVVDAPDSVHRSRVATRRARSALRTFAPLFKRRRVRELRDELAWHADHLGAPRDAEVLKERLLAALATLDESDVIGPVRERLTGALDATHARAHASLVDSMATPRYTALRDAMERLVADPPVRDSAADAPLQLLADLLDRAVDRVRRLTARAAELEDDDHRWHEARKAAKAARYCSEALVPAFGDPAKALVDAWEAVTEALGEFQDTVVAEAYLATDAALARAAGEPADTYLTLVLLELGLRDEALARGRAALDRALELPPMR